MGAADKLRQTLFKFADLWAQNGLAVVQHPLENGVKALPIGAEARRYINERNLQRGPMRALRGAAI